MIIRRADPKESRILTDLAVVSEAFWGHDKKFIEKFRLIYNIKEDYIRNNPTFVLEKEEKIIGFYSLVENGKEVVLEYFYIDPGAIKKGYGNKMWDHLVDYCKNRGILEFQYVAGKETRDFYEKMGAVIVGETNSIINKDRRIDKWKMVL